MEFKKFCSNIKHYNKGLKDGKVLTKVDIKGLSWWKRLFNRF